MNERILALATQAAGEDFQTFGCGMLISQDKIELFARLIVRECAGLCSATAAGRDADAIEAAILQHFGVEE